MAQPTILLSKFGRRTRRTLRITGAWMLIAGFTALLESNALVHSGAAPERLRILGQHLEHALVGGLFFGGCYIFLLHDPLRKMSFTRGIAIVLGLVLAATLLWDGLLPRLWPQGPASTPDEWRVIGHFLQWGLLMGGTMLILRLNDQYGGGSMSYLFDRYRKPRQELRIFMFLDMRSSTTVAESIGDTRYFKLLNDLYADVTDPVVYSGGEIYQYVGDEISVSWRLERGIRNDRCIKCFFAIRDKLQNRAEYYRSTYGTEPVFKAGFHFGRVTSGEVGIVKKQTIFSGDVVNTAAHIQASCNEMRVDNLVSKELLDVLSLRSLPYTVSPVGSIPLKGKRNAVSLFTFSLVQKSQ